MKLSLSDRWRNAAMPNDPSERQPRTARSGSGTQCSYSLTPQKRDGWWLFARLDGSVSSHRSSSSLFVKLSPTADSVIAPIQRQPWSVQTRQQRPTRHTIVRRVEPCQTLREPDNARSICGTDSPLILNNQSSTGTAQRVQRGRTIKLTHSRDSAAKIQERLCET